MLMKMHLAAAPVAAAAAPCGQRQASAAARSAAPVLRPAFSAAGPVSRQQHRRRQQHASGVAFSAPAEASTAAAQAAAAALPEEAAELSAEAHQQWAQCLALLQERCGLEGEAANAALLKAFGWKGQGFWRQERVKETPNPAQVTSALDFLAGLGLAEAADLQKLVQVFPEALGLRVEVMADNVQVLKDKWSMKGTVLLNAVKRKPRVLGNCIDCEGNCAGLCTRCWAQF
ncbi:hypothetical protein ABPG75_010912 [Micractinium tetrahymenae]